MYIYSGEREREKKHFYFFEILFIYFREGREGEREEETHQYVVAFHVPLVGDLACNKDMWPEWESNQQPFGSQAGVQSTEPHQPGQFIYL